MRETLVLTEHRSVRPHKVSRQRPFPRALIDKVRIVAVRHKADFLAVRLRCDRKPGRCRDGAHLGLLVLSDRHQGMGKLALREVIERIALILCGGLGACERVAPVFKRQHPRVVTGRNVIRPEHKAARKQRFPLHIAIAGNAGIRRAPKAVLPHKVIDDIALEFRAKVHHIVGDVQHLRHTARIFHGGNAAATALFLHLALRLALPDLHGHADYFIALLLQEVGSDRAVHTAGHADYHLLAHSFFLSVS